MIHTELHRFTRPWPARILMLASLALASRATAAEPGWHKVAAIDATAPERDGFATAATPYRYSLEEIPAAALPAGAPARAVLFGSTLEFRFAGVQPQAQYQVRANFLSDSDTREEQVEAGDAPLEPRLVLPRNQVLSKSWPVPASALAGGELAVKLTALAGANAVVSALEIWSTDATPLKSPPPLADTVAQMPLPLPRLSPLPVRVAGVSKPTILLNGTWKFNPVAPGLPGSVTSAAAGKWKHIAVPGEWVMEGFTVATNQFACYYRGFDVPRDWAGQRVKLRFDTVHSECKVWVNGQEVGGHEGGFVPFELDITAATKAGANTLVVAVRSESLADVLASATQYAGHPLGGITRKVTLFAVPQLNLAAQAITTSFDAGFQNATLGVRWAIANESAADATQAALALSLNGPDGKPVVLPTAKLALPVIRAGQTLTQEVAIPVPAPKQWDTEHPYLYTLRTELQGVGGASELIAQRFGFRQVEVRGQQVLVNGHPIKLHGVCRHETHPLLGRSLTPELWRQDAETFRAANVNYIRTSHYPPAEEFLDACDELGLFVECESPLCWVQHGANTAWGKWNYQDAKFLPYLARANFENVTANRNHPSVILWSLANESHWSPLFAEVNRRVKQLDPSRPTSFHDQCWGDYNAGGSHADIANYHYPGTNGPAKCDAGTRPTLFGEYCHVQTYNQREHYTDPGVRDEWGPRFGEMYDLMYRHPGCLGGAIWSGIDDAFDLPDGQVEGYGCWGVIDGWRRAKPETFHVRKAYSPIRVTTRELPAGAGPLKIAVENRYNFANLGEVRIDWSLGKETGTSRADIAPRNSGEFPITPKHPHPAGETLRLSFTDPRGFVCESVQIPVGQPAPAVAVAQPLKPGRLTLATSDRSYTVTGAEFTCEIDRQTGEIRQATVAGKPVLVGGPVLMVLPMDGGPCTPQDLTQFGPLNPVCQGWKAKSVSATKSDGRVVIRVEGEYAEAAGSYALTIKAEGALELSYNFVSRQAISPRQVGMVFYVARDCDRLAWQRNAEWSDYPNGHIGRPSGEARANPNTASHVIHLASAPKQGWEQDTTALGTADFRSSKSLLVSASLRNGRGRGLVLRSDGSQTARAFVDGGRIGWLIAYVNAGGGEGFFGAHHAADRRPLKNGTLISNTIRLQLTAP